MNTATPTPCMSTDYAPVFTAIFSHHVFASDIPPFVLIPSEHSLSKLAALPLHFKTMCRWPPGHNPAGSHHALENRGSVSSPLR